MTKLDEDIWGEPPTWWELFCAKWRNRYRLVRAEFRYRVLRYERPPPHDGNCVWFIEPWADCNCSLKDFYDRVNQEGWPKRKLFN